MSYQKWLDDRSQLSGNFGFEPTFLPDCLFDFQKHLVVWAVNKGKCALLEECGMGKSLQELVFSENVVRKTNKPVLILTPLAVAQQTVREGEKFGIECHFSRDGKSPKGIVITNYEKLHLFNSSDFAGVVCDESGILKNFDGKTKAAITEFMRRIPYRLLCTATPAPNDYIELGTSSEALGDLGYMDMLSKFFKNNQNSNHPTTYRQRGADFKALEEGAKFRFRGHAETDFWKWVCSWARAVRKPSDLGFDDTKFILPELITTQHMIEAPSFIPDGFLFPEAAKSLLEQRQERRRTLKERCQKVADLINPTGKSALAWCNLNDEGDLLAEMIPGSVQVSGSDEDEKKEEAFQAFCDGQIRVLITKSKIAGFGLNFQHCAHQTFFPSHSFEQWYQAIRRSWRFGQKNPVTIDVITSEGEARVLANLQRKACAAETMFSRLVELMNEGMNLNRSNPFTQSQILPSWLNQ